MGLVRTLGVGRGGATVVLGRGDAIGSRDGVGIGSKIGLGIGCSVKISVASGVGEGRDLGVGASSVGDGPRWRKGVEAASCARINGEAARKTVAIASKRVVFFRMSPSAN